MKTSDPKFYRYDPSLAAAVIFLILFLLTTTLHLYQLLRTRTWYFIPFLIGGFCQSATLGIVGRQASHHMLISLYS